MPVGVAALPGSERVYDLDRKDWQTLAAPNRPGFLTDGGGWLVGVSATSQPGRQREAAVSFVTYLSSRDTAARLVANRDFPLLPTRASQLGAGLPDARNAPGVDSRSWSRAVAATLSAARSCRPCGCPRPAAIWPTCPGPVARRWSVVRRRKWR